MVQHYTHRRLDDAMRAMMAIDWLAREEEQPGTIDRWRTDGRRLEVSPNPSREMEEATQQMEAARKAGKELR